MGFPGLELLQCRQMLAGIAAPNVENDVVRFLQRFSDRARVPFLPIDRKGRRDTLAKWLKRLDADALFVASFPWKIPEPVLSIPALGSFNFHPGALPEYRGIEPIFWAIRNGEKQTAVSVIRMDKGFDTGDVVLSVELPIHANDTYGLLTNKLSVVVRSAMEALLRRLLEKEPPGSQPQPANSHPNRRRPDLSSLTVSWREQTIEQIRDLTRAANPVYGGAAVTLRAIPFRLLEVSRTELPPEPGLMPGTVLRADPRSGLIVACADGALKIGVISGQEGTFRGETFAAAYGIGRGDLFSS